MMDFEHLSSQMRLAFDLALRDLEAKYKRASLGWAWILMTPLCLLGIYFLVFGKILGIEWQDTNERQGDSVGFILPFFVGLSIYLFISDVISSSSTLLVSKRTYVVKSSFPIWVLWMSNLIRSGIIGSVPFVLVLLLALFQGRLTFVGCIWIVASLVSMFVFTAGISLFLTSLGPFVGDISEAIRLLMRVFFYATPIAYPITAAPENLRIWLWLNPLTSMIEPMRAAIVFGRAPTTQQALWFGITSVALMVFSVWMFRRVKGVIADVV